MATSHRTQLLDELTQIHAAMQDGLMRIRLASLDAHPLTFGQLRALALLLVDGPARPGELAQRLSVSPATCSGMLDRMATAGLIADEAVPGDARGRLVRPTDQGREAVTDLLITPSTDPRWIPDGITDDELAALVTGMRAILREHGR